MGMLKEAEMIESQSRGGGAGGAPVAQPGIAPAPAQPQTTDYSAQWAEYYRSIGMYIRGG